MALAAASMINCRRAASKQQKIQSSIRLHPIIVTIGSSPCSEHTSTDYFYFSTAIVPIRWRFARQVPIAAVHTPQNLIRDIHSVLLNVCFVLLSTGSRVTTGHDWAVEHSMALLWPACCLLRPNVISHCLICEPHITYVSSVQSFSLT